MRRGAKPAKAKVKPRLPLARRSLKNKGSKVRDLEKRLAESLEREKATGEILQEKNRALTAALDQETATAEILRVISSSPTDAQPVFDVIVRSAVRLCAGLHSNVYRVQDGLIHLVAHYNFSPAALALLRHSFPIPVSEEASIPARVIREAAVTHLRDAQTDADVPEFTRRTTRALGARSVLYVPMLRHGSAIGVIVISRGEVKPFSEKEIELIKTFAAQAVIAVDNVRLFRELQARNRELTDSLAHQTATAEVLRIISRSPTDAQPVFEAINDSALRLCQAQYSGIFRVEDGLIHVMAIGNPTPEGRARAAEVMRRHYPRPPSREGLVARAVLERTIVHVPDVTVALVATAEVSTAIGFRSQLSVPMLRDGVPVGAIAVGRTEAGLFSDEQITLLQTFADQAVIAIENVRLFTELQDKNRALTEAHAQVTEALEQQTATSEILRVISSSPTDVQPVFEAVVVSAARLCQATDASLHRVEGEMLRHVASYGAVTSLAPGETRRITRGSGSGRAVLTGRTIHVHDILAEGREEYPDVWQGVERHGIRTFLARRRSSRSSARSGATTPASRRAQGLA